MVLSNSGKSGFRGVMMVQKISLVVLSAGLLASAWCENGKVEYKPLNFGGFSEFGLMRSGQYGEVDFKNEWVDHFGAYIAQTAQVNENLAFDIGIGGVFEYQKREIISSGWGGTQYKSFFVGPSVADIRYGGAARDGQGLGLTLGIFNYKYNPDASNLGEYLFRSGAYPGYVTSGGFWFVNNSSVQVQGLKASYGSGALTGDLLLLTETSMPSLYDISAAAIVGYKVANGFIDLGAGLNYKHMIPVKPSHTTRHHVVNAYFTRGTTTYSANDAIYLEKSNFYKRRATEDPTNAANWNVLANAEKATADSVLEWVTKRDSNGIKLEYYTQTGLIAMARASVDFKKLFDSDAFGKDDFRLFFEGAILGIQNYPIYYTKISERIPLMAGFNFPCYRILDLLSIQVEYYKSPYLNSYSSLVEYNAAVPQHALGNDKVRSGTEYQDITKKDDVSWSVLAKKNIGGGSYISAQVARDHIRTVSIETWTAPEPTQVLGRSSDWYWMLQFGFGI